jgi:hypothetical protein
VKRLDNIDGDFLFSKLEGDPEITKKKFLKRGEGKGALSKNAKKLPP